MTISLTDDTSADTNTTEEPMTCDSRSQEDLVNDPADIEVERRFFPGTRFGGVERHYRKDGGPMRVINGRWNRPMHRAPSAKTGLSHFFESDLELCDGRHAEADTSVVSYQTQPETLRYLFNGVWHSYTPDRIEVRSGRTLRIVEVKDDDYAARDPELAAKLDVVREVYGLLGIPMAVRTRAMIRAEPLYSAVETIWAYRFTLVTIEQAVCAWDLLEHGELPFEEFIRRLPSPHPRQSALAMVVNRAIHMDLTHGLRGTNLVSRIEE